MFPEKSDLLVTLPGGGYTWNHDVCLKLDVERFEAACLNARRTAGEEKCELLLQAVSLYKGEFLSGNGNEWARVLRQYYQTLYLDACKILLPLLYKEEKWMEILNICGQAYHVDFTIEDFTVYQMQALNALGLPERAIEKYELFRDKMLQELEMMPTSQAERLYTLTVGLRKKDAEKQDIFKMLCGEEDGRQAFFCTFEIFQNIVALEKRHIERSGQESSVAIVSLEKEAVPVTDARRLERILLEGLRTGDPVARLEANSYIVMLTGATVERASYVMGRIDREFHKTYRHSKAHLNYQIAPLNLEGAG